MPLETDLDTHQDKRLYLVYDKQCPACDHYARLAQVRQTVGDLELVDAREGGPLVDAITARGLDIDEGMVLIVDDQFYYGDEAIHRLALLGTRSGLFNRLNYLVFKSATRSRLLYPILRRCRNLLLKLLGKTRVNNLECPDNDRF